MTQQIEEIKVSQIDPSPFQPRRTFAPGPMAELVASVRERGIIQPLLVRRVGKRIELVGGERRYRAAKEVGLAAVPAIVRELTDQEARELVIIENLQREGLTLLEEAAGYADALALRDEAGKAVYTVDQLAARISKDPTYIRQRKKLMVLPEVALEALRSGLISFSLARVLSRVPGEKLRKKASEEIIKPTFGEEPLTVLEAERVLRTKYMHELKGAPFDLKAADLVPVERDEAGERICGGSCGDCPFRTGNNPEEFGVAVGEQGKGGARADMCTHLDCYYKKVDASWEEQKADALRSGKRVLSQKEGEKLFAREDEDRLVHSSPYVNIAEQVPREKLVDPDQKRVPSWKKVLEGAEVPPEIVVVRSGTGRVLELVDQRQAEAALKLAEKSTGKSSGIRLGKVQSGLSAAEKAEREKKKLTIAVAHRGMTALVKAIANQGLVAGFWEGLLNASLTHAGADGLWMIGKRLGVEPVKVSHSSAKDYESVILDHWKGEAPEEIRAARVLEMLLAQRLKWTGVAAAEFASMAELYAVDLKAIEKEVKAELAVARKPKKAAQVNAEES